MLMACYQRYCIRIASYTSAPELTNALSQEQKLSSESNPQYATGATSATRLHACSLLSVVMHVSSLQPCFCIEGTSMLLTHGNHPFLRR